LHDEIGRYARDRGVERLLALGELSAVAALAFGNGATHFGKPEDLVGALEAGLDGDVALLVKGSRFMRMERIVEAITEKNHVA